MTPIPPARVHARGGYTLVEILVATTLTLILMFAVVQIFAMIGGSVSESRALLEMNDRLRAAKTRLQMDLGGLTVVPLPPRGEEDDGYLEIIEGAVMTPIVTPSPAGTVLPKLVGRTTIDGGTPVPPTSDGFWDDTTIADFDDIRMFTTRNTRTSFVDSADSSRQSDVAEVAWFVHGNRLYRRVKPVECDSATGRPDLSNLTLRTYREWHAGGSATPPSNAARDFWTNNAATGLNVGSFAPNDHDVILTNVIGFDVKVFDPLWGDYVDLGYDSDGTLATSPTSFSHTGMTASGLGGRIYDTWSASDSNPPPYPSALRGIQIKIRVFEPDSRQIREVTVIQDFLPR